jgi:hypothetical protein
VLKGKELGTMLSSSVPADKDQRPNSMGNAEFESYRSDYEEFKSLNPCSSPV